MVAAACGDVVKSGSDGTDVDAPVADAAVDAADASPVSGPVTVHVRKLDGDGVGALDLTATVVFHDSAGTLFADGVVDATGTFTGEMPAEGGDVTVIRRLQETTASVLAVMSTVTGVQPGESIEFGLAARGNTSGTTESMQARFAPISNVSPPTFYTECGSTSGVPSPQPLSLFSTCHGANVDVFASALDANGKRHFAVATSPFVQGGTISVPPFTGVYSEFDVKLSNVPAGLSRISGTRYSVLGDTQVDPQPLTTLPAPPAGTATMLGDYPAAPGLRTQLALAFDRADSSTRQSVLSRTADLTGAVMIDLAASTLPWITRNSFSATVGGFTWTVVQPGGDGDAMAPVWTGSWNPGQRNTTVAWRITTPWNATGFVLPRLPPAYAEYDPQAQTVAVAVSTRSNVTVYDYDQVPDFATFRKHHDQLLTDVVDAAVLFGATAFSSRQATTSSQ